MPSNLRPAEGARDLYSQQSYKYDQLNRIKKSREFHGGSISDNSYRTAYEYDGNGNILTLKRWGAAGAMLDDLTYHYNRIAGTQKLDNNKLRHVNDPLGVVVPLSDIGDQQPDNYTYDAIGNLVKDNLEGIAQGGIKWRADGKIKSITKNGMDMIYRYDVAGNRVAQVVKKPTGWEHLFHVRDASGNILATYSRRVENNQLVTKLDEHHLYGSSRLGALSNGQPIASENYSVTAHTTEDGFLYICPRNVALPETSGIAVRSLGKKGYELVDHLGNLRAIIGDERMKDAATWLAILKTTTNYYPFGMEMPGRKSGEMKFGYNGQLKDPELWGGALAFKYRVEDNRLGRFFSVDPLASSYPWNSTYAFAENRVIDGLELEGAEWIDFRFKSWLKDNSSYTTGLLYGFGDGLLETADMGLTLIDKIGTHSPVLPTAPYINPRFFTESARKDRAKTKEFVGVALKVINSEQLRNQVWGSIKQELGVWWEEITFGKTEGQAGYQHGKLVFEILTMVIGVGEVQSLMKTGKFSVDALGKLKAVVGKGEKVFVALSRYRLVSRGLYSGIPLPKIVKKMVKNQGGELVERSLVQNEDELLDVARHYIGDLKDGVEIKDGWWEGIGPNGAKRRVEYQVAGEGHMGEGPHVKVVDYIIGSKGKPKGTVTAKYFIEGKESF